LEDYNAKQSEEQPRAIIEKPGKRVERSIVVIKRRGNKFKSPHDSLQAKICKPGFNRGLKYS